MTMRILFTFGFLVLGCGGANVQIAEAGADADAGGGSETGPADTGSDSPSSACKAATINLTFDTCPAPPTCGGTLVDGTYHYTTGCLVDPWAAAKQSCPTLTVSEQKGTVKGCVTFASGAVTRDVVATYGAKLDLPASCALAQCPAAENALKMYFMMASCAAGATPGSCTCTVSTTSSSVATGGYTVQGAQIVTSTNNRYDFCAKGNVLGLRWASGPTPEPGIYDLTKQ